MMLKTCSTCKNDYDKPLEIVKDGVHYYFDSFQCAIQLLAPVCAHCGTRMIGHGVENQGVMFCGAHCARSEGAIGVKDRAETILGIAP